MANHKSALKRVAVTAKKNLNNRVITSRVKTAIKSFDDKGEVTAYTCNVMFYAAKGETLDVLVVDVTNELDTDVYPN